MTGCSHRRVGWMRKCCLVKDFKNNILYHYEYESGNSKLMAFVFRLFCMRKCDAYVLSCDVLCFNNALINQLNFV